MKKFKNKSLSVATVLAFINMFALILFQEEIFNLNHSFLMMCGYIVAFMINIVVISIYIEYNETQIIGRIERIVRHR